MAKTIQIPGTGKDEDDQENPVGLNCPVSLDFLLDGTFDRDAAGDQFVPPLPVGPVTAGNYAACTSPSKPVEVWWRFKSPLLTKPVHGIIEVERSGNCTNPKNVESDD
jgi:hypothetical protein